jgi:ABC-2 type transport system permease protein
VFSHIFVNRFKCLIRDRALVFWTLLYPVVLATLFALAFSNLSSSDAFKSIPVAVVSNAEYQGDTEFKSALDSVSDDNPDSADKLFHISVVTQQQAEDSLKNNEIKGYILLQNGPQIYVRDSGIDQTIIKQFADNYIQVSAAYKDVISKDPSAAAKLKYDGSKDFIEAVAPGKGAPNDTLTYFYALLAMASLFGGFWGKKEIADIQADLTPQGQRINIAPVHKLKAFGASFLASVTLQFILLVILVIYLNIVLKVDFGDQLLFVLFTCLVGSFTGVTFGALIGAVVKGGEHIKTSVLIGVSLIFSFMAGMMVQSVKTIITDSVPILTYINPANLITDAFYSLYYYNTYTRFLECIGILLGMSAVFYLIVYFVTRRQRYASI